MYISSINEVMKSLMPLRRSFSSVLITGLLILVLFEIYSIVSVKNALINF